MAKIHIHSNCPQKVFDQVRQFSRHAELKKEKVEDMWAMREDAHGESKPFEDLSDAKFSVFGFPNTLPPQYRSDEVGQFPVFVVPSNTQEPIDIRYGSDADLCLALNAQRHKETKVRYTTAAPNPMQVKIELLALLAKKKPILVFIMSTDKRVSAMGRNILQAIDMLTPEQQQLCKVLVHGWGSYEGIFVKEALEYAKQGKTIEEAHAAVKEFADRRFFSLSVMSSQTVKGLVAWRPGLFPKNFTVPDGSFYAFGQAPVIREGEPWSDLKRAGSLMNMLGQGTTLEGTIDAEVKRIQDTLQPGQSIASLWVTCVGRPDKGQAFVEKVKAAGIPLLEEPVVYGTTFLSLALSSWGEFSVTYKVV